MSTGMTSQQLGQLDLQVQNGQYFATNPRTGQLEPLVFNLLESTNAAGTSGSDNAFNNDPYQAAAYFQSELPAGALAQPMLFDEQGTFESVMNPLIQAGIIAGSAYTGLGAAGAFGASAAGAGAAGAGELAAAEGTAELLGGAGADALGGGAFTGGFTGTAAGAPGLAAGGFDAAALGAGGGAALTPGGLTAAGVTGAGALSPGFFGAESLYPVAGGLSAASLPNSPTPPSPSGSPLSNLTGLDPNLTSLLGILGATGLGLVGANQQTNALNDLSAAENARFQQLFNAGAPYRTQLETLMSDPSTYLSSPMVQTSVDQGTSALARSLSAQVGNPALSGTALHELQNYATNAFADDYYKQAQLLGNLGGLSQFAGGAAQGPNLGPAMAGVQSGANTYNVLGAGLADATRPRSSLNDILRTLI